MAEGGSPPGASARTRKAPAPTDNVVRSTPSAASTSATRSPVTARSVSSSTVSAPGTVCTGASLTAAIDSAMVFKSVLGPPAPPCPWSLACTVSVSLPAKSGRGR